MYRPCRWCQLVLCYIWMNLYCRGGGLRTRDSWLCCSCQVRSKEFPGFSPKAEVTGAWIEVWWCVNWSDRRKRKKKTKTPKENRRYIAARRLDFLLFSEYLCMRQNLYLWVYGPRTWGKEKEKQFLNTTIHISYLLHLFIPILHCFFFAPLFVIASVLLNTLDKTLIF